MKFTIETEAIPRNSEVFLDIMLTWDGTRLHKEPVPIAVGHFDRKTYWKLDSRTYCIVRKMKNITPCIVDEIKGIFGIQKTGTRWFMRNDDVYILFKCVFDTKNDRILLDIPVSEIDDKSLNSFFPGRTLKDNIRRLIVFRELMSIEKTRMKDILLRVKENGARLISDEEGKVKFGDCINTSTDIITQWFGGDETFLLKVLCSILPEKKLSLERRLYSLRVKLEEVINRIDKNSVWLVSSIIGRIALLLTSIID